MVEPIFDYQFRIIIIGDSTVGKSSLLKYFTDGKFAEVYIFMEKVKRSRFTIFKMRIVNKSRSLQTRIIKILFSTSIIMITMLCKNCTLFVSCKHSFT